jgi:hypothetical protein
MRERKPPVRAWLICIEPELIYRHQRGRRACDDRWSLISASPVVVCSPPLRHGPQRAQCRENCYCHGDPKLAPCKVNSAANNLYWLSVPMKSSISIDSQAVYFGCRNRPNGGGPLRLIDGLMRYPLQFVRALLVLARYTASTLLIGLQVISPSPSAALGGFEWISKVA